MIEIRSFRPEDFRLLLDLANQAVPFAAEANAEWLEYRQAFDESQRLRRHYIAEDHHHHPVGYGCLEQQGNDPKTLRIYVVCSPQHLQADIGAVLYARLLHDAKDIGATLLWARELQDDRPACRFFVRHGFVETQRVTPLNISPVVVFQLALEQRQTQDTA
jgi:GNAT superfamily N-acetyltransferase